VDKGRTVSGICVARLKNSCCRFSPEYLRSCSLLKTDLDIDRVLKGSGIDFLLIKKAMTLTICFILLCLQFLVRGVIPASWNILKGWALFFYEKT